MPAVPESRSALLDLRRGMLRECASAFEPLLVVRSPPQCEERVRIPRRPVAESRRVPDWASLPDETTGREQHVAPGVVFACAIPHGGKDARGAVAPLHADPLAIQQRLA